MKRTIRVKFTESSKAVTAETLIQYETENDRFYPRNEEIEQECRELFESAQKYATKKTMEKLR